MNQISGVAKNVNWGGASSAFSSPSFPVSFLLSLFLPSSLIRLFSHFPFLSLPLEVRQPHPVSGPRPKSILVHFIFKWWDLLATILIIFPRINWPNWQIQCCLNAYYVLSGGLAPLGSLLSTPLSWIPSTFIRKMSLRGHETVMHRHAVWEQGSLIYSVQRREPISDTFTSISIKLVWQS